MDPYQLLGVKPGASAEELHDAYRRLVKLHHPDRNGGSAESTRRFQEIQRAFETLRGRPAPDETLEERLARLEAELAKPAPRDRREDPSVTRVNSLIDGLDEISSSLDDL